MLLAWWLNALALAFATGLGVRALLDPHWVARFVRLRADAQDGGFSEFRAAYGGAMAALHGAALILTLKYMVDGVHVIGLAAAGAAAPIAAGWAGLAVGRAFSMWRDGAPARTRFNMIRAGVAAALALCIGAPWLWWFLAPPG